jgi:hypothetical protein
MATWVKLSSERWNLKSYEHTSGKIRVNRHARSHSRAIKDGRFTVGRTTFTTRWSTILIHRSLLSQHAIASEAVKPTGEDDWFRVESTEITCSDLRKAQTIAEGLLSGSRGLRLHPPPPGYVGGTVLLGA